MTVPFKHKYQQEPQSLTLVFRKAQRHDLRQTMRIYMAGFEGNRGQDYFARRLKDPKFQFNIASLNNKIVGFTLINGAYDANTALLGFIGVDPAVRGQGIGKGLMQEAEKAAIHFRQPKMQLMVREDNTSAIGFYKKLGYAPLHTIPHLYSNGINAIVMEKQITAAGQTLNLNSIKSPSLTI